MGRRAKHISCSKASLPFMPDILAFCVPSQQCNQQSTQTLRHPLHEVVVLALIVHPNVIDVVTIEVPPEDIRVLLDDLTESMGARGNKCIYILLVGTYQGIHLARQWKQYHVKHKTLPPQTIAIKPRPQKYTRTAAASNHAYPSRWNFISP